MVNYKKAYENLLAGIATEEDKNQIKKLVKRATFRKVYGVMDTIGDGSIPGGTIDFWTPYCPECQEELPMEYEPSYCPCCGQAIDWDIDDE